MNITDTDGSGHALGAAVLSHTESERIIESRLKRMPLSAVGTPAWMKQHEAVQKLNLQAHHCVISKSDNFVLEQLVTHDKVGTLVHELLVAEAWGEFIYPEIKAEVALRRRSGALRTYFIRYHEAALINLLEVIMYHDYVAEAAGDLCIELVDYCVRRVLSLVSRPPPRAEARRSAQEVVAEMQKRTALDDLERQAAEIEFRSAVSAVTVLRYLTEHVSKLPLAVMTRLLDTHDVMVAVVPLIENPPWTRRTDEGAWEKYKENAWREVEASALLKLTKHEAQVWLILYNLMCDAECRKRYAFSGHRKDTIMRVRKYINEVLVDQVPVLCEVQRYLDELTIMNAPPAAQAGSHFVMEQLATVRDGILREYGGRGRRRRPVGDDPNDGDPNDGDPNGQEEGRESSVSWRTTARRVLEAAYGEDGDQADLMALAGMYAADGVAELFGDAPAEADPNAASDGGTAAGSVGADVLSAVVEVVGVVGGSRGEDLGGRDGDGALDKGTEMSFAVSTAEAPETSATSKGLFKRFRLEPLGAAPPVPHDAVLRVTALRSDGCTIELESAPLGLPAQAVSERGPEGAAGEMVDVAEALSEAVWTRMGSLEEQAVAQLKLSKRRSVLRKHASGGLLHCYGMSELYLSVYVGEP
jgi:hypothetical protein